MLNNIIVKNMELKRDWEMQEWRNPLLISQDLRAPKQGAGAALFRHYLIIKVVVGRWCGLARVWGWETRCGTLFFVPVCTFTSSPHQFLWVQSSLSWLRLFLTPGDRYSELSRACFFPTCATDRLRDLGKLLNICFLIQKMMMILTCLPRGAFGLH